MSIRFFLFLFLFSFAAHAHQTRIIPLTIHTPQKTISLKVEVAEAPEDLEVGLMYRKSLEPNTGLLFLMGKEALHSFWMKNTYISLDILFIDKNKHIAFIAENTTPMSTRAIVPSEPVLYVLEVVGGFVKKNDIGIGDAVGF